MSRYRSQQIAYKTNCLASTDLDVYMKALDKALIQFHQAKMKEINEVLREYWRATYSGKDIDEVYICSDHTVKESGRRNYNYRVVMRQGDTGKLHDFIIPK
jgi:DNA repair protein RAD50